MKSKRLFFSLIVLCITAVGGTFYFFSQTKQEISKNSEEKIVQATNAKVPRKEEQSKPEKSADKDFNISELKTTTEEKRMQEERETFNKKVLSQDYYVENVDSKGKLTYVKATEKALQELEAKAKNNQLSIYQVNHDGQMISVLSKS